MDDLISRSDAIGAVKEERFPIDSDYAEGFMAALDKVEWILKEWLPSAQPEHTNSCYTNSWCIDCKEYDKEKHSCPRFNRVIKQTLDEVYAHAETEAEARYHAQQRWIPCSERLPENGHYYLWCSDMGSVQSDYYWDGFENGMKYGYNIVAWMPLPEPYQAERRTDETDYRKE